MLCTSSRETSSGVLRASLRGYDDECPFLLFHGAESFEHIVLSRFWHIADSFAVVFRLRPTWTLILVSAFIGGTRDFITFAASLNALGNLFAISCKCTILHTSFSHCEVHESK